MQKNNEIQIENQTNVEIKRSHIMCKAAEVGKIVINKCIDANICIDTQKLQKLLVLMQVECIKRSGRPLFKEDIRKWDCGVAIKEVDEEFRGIGGDFTEKQQEYIVLLEQEEKSVNYILQQFGDKGAIELNELPTNQKVLAMCETFEGFTVPHVHFGKLIGAFGKL